MFAIISAEGVLMTFLTLGVFALIFWLLWYLVDYFGPAEPFNKILRAILVIGAVIVCINALLSLIGRGFTF